MLEAWYLTQREQSIEKQSTYRGVTVHVLQVTPYYPPTWAYGGIPRIVYGLSRALVSEGVEVSVWTTDAMDSSNRSKVPPIRVDDGVNVFVSKNLSNRLAYSQQLFLPRNYKVALDAVGQVDLIHLHGHRHLLNNAAIAYAKRNNIPWVMTPNGTLPRHEKKVAPKAIWDALIANRVPAGASRMIAVSGVEVGHMRRAGIPQERIAQIPNGLTLEEFSNLPARGAFRSKHNIDGPIVAYLGQVSPRKGVSHLVEAFREHKMMGSTLVVGGNDMGAMSHAKSVASTISGERVIFTGLLEGDDRLSLLVDADVLVYPSTDEIFGLVPFEGLLCGAPVVVGGDCGCGQLIQQAGAGLLVRHADVEGLRDRILTLLSDRVAAEAMVKRGRDYITSNLGFSGIAQEHIALYNTVIEHHKSGVRT